MIALVLVIDPEGRLLLLGIDEIGVDFFLLLLAIQGRKLFALAQLHRSHTVRPLSGRLGTLPIATAGSVVIHAASVLGRLLCDPIELCDVSHWMLGRTRCCRRAIRCDRVVQQSPKQRPVSNGPTERIRPWLENARSIASQGPRREEAARPAKSANLTAANH